MVEHLDGILPRTVNRRPVRRLARSQLYAEGQVLPLQPSGHDPRHRSSGLPSGRRAGCPRPAIGGSEKSPRQDREYEAQPSIAAQGEAQPCRRVGVAQPAPHDPDRTGAAVRAVAKLLFPLPNQGFPARFLGLSLSYDIVREHGGNHHLRVQAR